MICTYTVWTSNFLKKKRKCTFPNSFKMELLGRGKNWAPHAGKNDMRSAYFYFSKFKKIVIFFQVVLSELFQ